MASKAKVFNLNSKDSKAKKKKDLKKKKSKQSHKPKAKKTSPKQYMKEVQIELKKVAWPSRSQVFIFSVIVLIAVVLFSLYTFGLDVLFRYILQLTTR